MLKRVIIFLIINFAALAIGSMFTTNGVSSDWYQSLSKAPWTPPGWVFGAAWTTIMICFSFFMAYLWPKVESQKGLGTLFAVQWVLNVIWNPIFFKNQFVVTGLLVISLLTIVVAIFQFGFVKHLRLKALLVFPYMIWLLIATSLNAYILMNN